MNEKYYSKKTRSPDVVQLHACNRIGYGILGRVLEVVRTYFYMRVGYVFESLFSVEMI